MNRDSKRILGLLEKYPRANLLQVPSIIHKLPRLSSDLGYEIYILRDDLTGFALGGNKTKKLDYLIGDALDQKSDTLVTMNATSFSRNAAVAASACGLELYVVLAGIESEQNRLSQAIFNQCGTNLYYVPEAEGTLPMVQRRLVESLRKKGREVYTLHPGGSDTIGALSYVRTFAEILDFSNRSGIHFPQIFHATSSTGTQAGMVVGQSISDYETKIIGVCASMDSKVQSERIRELTLSTADMLGVQADEKKIVVDDGFIGPGYSIPSEEGRHAVNLFANLEGIILDQAYTGKAAAALLHYVKNEGFDGDSVLFIHTGGNGGLFY